MRPYTGAGGGNLFRHYPVFHDIPEPPVFIQQWRTSVLARYTAGVRAAVANEMRALDEASYRNGSIRLGERDRELRQARVGLAFDEDLLRDRSELYAQWCRLMRPRESTDDLRQFRALRHRLDFAASVGVAIHASRRITFEGLVARLEDPQWWRRQLRKLWTRGAENCCRSMGMVHRCAAPFLTEDSCRLRADQHRRSDQFLKSHVLRNGEGEQLNLWEVSQRSIANPALRRGELMVRARGFEEIAKTAKHDAVFVTATAPSAFHVRRGSDGSENPSFAGFSPRDAQAWLCRTWARARARLKRQSIYVYGFRVAEPHHDGTPHWHLLLFVAPHHANALRRILTWYWLSEYGDEPGAAEHRINFKTIDPEKGSAAGYLAKYISKNIDGAGSIAGMPSDETDGSVGSTLNRVEAWASIHGIRQFQQIGGPPVGLWRELRRLRNAVADRDIERARLCADSGNWAAFASAIACGDPFAGRKTALKLEKVETGELNRYGECRIARVIGLRYCSSVVITRPHRWRIERQNGPPSAHRRASLSRCVSGSVLSLHPVPLGPVGITVRGPHAPETCEWCRQEQDTWRRSVPRLMPPRSSESKQPGSA